MQETLQRVAWQTGQALLPEHLTAQEESLLSNIALRMEQQALPQHGIASLQWQENLLQQGILSLTAFTLVTAQSTLIDCPRNATLAPFNLNETGQSSVVLYLHLISTVEIRADDHSRLVYQLILSTEQEQLSASETLKLAHFEKSCEGVWTLQDDYIPPLIRLGSSPFCKTALQNLQVKLEQYIHHTKEQVATHFIRGENLFQLKYTLLELLKLQALISDIFCQVHHHPYTLYTALSNCRAVLELKQASSLPSLTIPYQHDQLHRCLKGTINTLLPLLDSQSSRSSYLDFSLNAGIYSIDPLAPELREARELYLLIQKERVNQSLQLDGFKLAAKGRLGMVHQLALIGIPFKKMDKLSFSDAFGPEVEIFSLQLGEEWDCALEEHSLAFYPIEGLSHLKAFIHWR